jgi:hypothetical protein
MSQSDILPPGDEPPIAAVVVLVPDNEVMRPGSGMSGRVRVVPDDEVPEPIDGPVCDPAAAPDVDIAAREEHVGPHLRGTRQPQRGATGVAPVALRPAAHVARGGGMMRIRRWAGSRTSGASATS